MTDSDFLRALKERHAAREKADRSFELLGETLTYRAGVAPEVGNRLQQAGAELFDFSKQMQATVESGGEKITEAEFAELMRNLGDARWRLFEIADQTALACLEPASHEAWARLRSEDAASPLSQDDVLEVARELVVRVTGLPTDAPTGSSDGRNGTAKRSKENSSSPASVPTG